MIIGDKNKVTGGDASCEAKNENETHQELEQDQGGKDKGGKKKDKKGNKKDGDNIQVGDQRNTSSRTPSARTGDVVIPKGHGNEVHGGKASCEAENENETPSGPRPGPGLTLLGNTPAGLPAGAPEDPRGR